MARYYGGRAMLNVPGHFGTAAMVAEVEDTSKSKRDKPRPHVQMDISDCERAIHFDFESFNYHETVGERNEAFANDLAKVDTMIELLRKFRHGLVSEQKRFVERGMR